MLFPANNEDFGMVRIGFMGPSCITDYSKVLALVILIRYLANTAESPLRKSMIDIEDPFASKVNGEARLFLESLLFFTFESVPLKKIDEILTKFMEVLVRISNKDEIDMVKMQSIIGKVYLESIIALESAPHDVLAIILLDEAVYGTKEADVSMECL